MKREDFHEKLNKVKGETNTSQMEGIIMGVLSEFEFKFNSLTLKRQGE
jgi:hypothetical protein